MFVADSHTHCNHSHDSFVPPEEMIENAIAKGASYMAMTDHCDKDYALIPEFFDVKQIDLDSHFKQARALQERYKGKLQIGVGLECGYYAPADKLYREILAQYPTDVVINSIESHHGDVEAKYIIAHLVAAADTLSAARPGARSETLETYVKRVEQLEGLAKSFEGVQQAYAMQSGREIRVMVMPEKISDAESVLLAQQLREKIEKEMTYPGQIKVSVIREYRAIETAK